VFTYFSLKENLHSNNYVLIIIDVEQYISIGTDNLTPTCSKGH